MEWQWKWKWKWKGCQFGHWTVLVWFDDSIHCIRGSLLCCVFTLLLRTSPGRLGNFLFSALYECRRLKLEIVSLSIGITYEHNSRCEIINEVVEENKLLIFSINSIRGKHERILWWELRELKLTDLNTVTMSSLNSYRVALSLDTMEAVADFNHSFTATRIDWEWGFEQKDPHTSLTSFLYTTSRIIIRFINSNFNYV